MSAKLLLIEDDYTLAAGLAYLLKDEGFELDLAHDAINGLVSMIEPILVAVLSVVIGGVLLSVMLPLLSVLSAIG